MKTMKKLMLFVLAPLFVLGIVFGGVGLFAGKQNEQTNEQTTQQYSYNWQEALAAGFSHESENGEYTLADGESLLLNLSEQQSRSDVCVITNPLIFYHENGVCKAKYKNEVESSLASTTIGGEKKESISMLSATRIGDTININVLSNTGTESHITASADAVFTLGDLVTGGEPVQFASSKIITRGISSLMTHSGDEPAAPFYPKAVDARIAYLQSGTMTFNNVTYGNAKPASGTNNTLVVGRAVYMTGGTLNLNNVTLQNFDVTQISSDSSSAYYSNDPDNKNGGAIYATAGTININTGTTIKDCKSSKGGAIYSLGTIAMSAGTISGNIAPSSNAIYNGGTCTISGGTLTHGTGGTLLVNSNSSSCSLTVSGGTFTKSDTSASTYVFDIDGASTFNLNGNPTITCGSASMFYLGSSAKVTVGATLTNTYTLYKGGITSFDDGDATSSYIAYSTNATYRESAYNKITVSNMAAWQQKNNGTKKTNYVVVASKTGTIYYTLNNGSHVAGYDESYTSSANQQTKNTTYCTRTGYTINTCSITTNSSGATSTLSGGTTSNGTLSIPATAYGDITITYTWTANTYAVTSDKSTYTDTLTVASSGTFDSGLSISWAAGSATGYTYSLSHVKVYGGTSTSGTLLATYSSGTSATFTMNTTTGYYENVYVYATHTREANKYSITIKVNGGGRTYTSWSGGSNTNSDQTIYARYDSNVLYTASDNVITTVSAYKTGYTCTGFWTASSDGTKKINQSSATLISNCDFTSNQTWYAQYSANDYIVTYDNLYTSFGWTHYVGGDGTSNSVYDENGETIYRWTAGSGVQYGPYLTGLKDRCAIGYRYRITFDAKASTNISTNVCLEGSSRAYQTLNLTTSYQTVTYDTTIESSGGALTFYWGWSQGNSLYIKNVRLSRIVTYDSAVGELFSPSMTGYTFNGWFTAASGGTQITSSTTYKTADNITIYAHISENTYWTNINIYSPGGAEDYASGTMTVNYNGAVYTNQTNEQSLYLPYSGYIEISAISPATGMYLSSVDGATHQGNGVYRRSVGKGGTINIYMAWSTYTLTASNGYWVANPNDSITVSASGCTISASDGRSAWESLTVYKGQTFYVSHTYSTSAVTVTETRNGSRDHTIWAYNGSDSGWNSHSGTWTPNANGSWTYYVREMYWVGASYGTVSVTNDPYWGTIQSSVSSGYAYYGNTVTFSASGSGSWCGWYTGPYASGSYVSGSTSFSVTLSGDMTYYAIYSKQFYFYNSSVGNGGTCYYNGTSYSPTYNTYTSITAYSSDIRFTKTFAGSALGLQVLTGNDSITKYVSNSYSSIDYTIGFGDIAAGGYYALTRYDGLDLAVRFYCGSNGKIKDHSSGSYSTSSFTKMVPFGLKIVNRGSNWYTYSFSTYIDTYASGNSGYTFNYWSEGGTISDNRILSDLSCTAYFKSTSSSGGGGGSCVTGDTEILTAFNGTTVTAANLNTGDQIVAYNQSTGKYVLSTVRLKYVAESKVYRIHFEDNTYLDITDNHKLLTTTGYRNICDDNIDVGETVVGRYGNKRITEIQLLSENRVSVYNFLTDKGDGFVANEAVIKGEDPNQPYILDGGVNAIAIKVDPGCVTGDTKILTTFNGKTVKAAELKEGDQIVAFNSITGKYILTTVKKKYIAYTYKVHRIHFEDGTTLDITNNHRLLTTDGYKNMCDDGIAAGDIVVGRYGNKRIIEIVLLEEQETQVYNFLPKVGDGFVANESVIEREDPSQQYIVDSGISQGTGAVKYNTPIGEGTYILLTSVLSEEQKTSGIALAGGEADSEKTAETAWFDDKHRILKKRHLGEFDLVINPDDDNTPNVLV